MAYQKIIQMADKKSFVIRIKPEMYEALERWANDEFRSVNGQIEYLLDESIKKQKRYYNKEKSSEADNKKKDAEKD